MEAKSRNHPNRKPLTHEVMGSQRGSYWLHNRSFHPTALRPEILDGYPTGAGKNKLIIAINFVSRTIEVGYSWEIPCDLPMGSKRPDEVYMFAHQGVRATYPDLADNVSAVDWQRLLLKMLAEIDAELQSDEITDAVREKVWNYFKLPDCYRQ